MGIDKGSFRTIAAFRLWCGVAFALLLAACSGGGGGGGNSGGGSGALIAPVIVTAPHSQSVADGQPATFSVVATGSAPLAYQWSRNGQAIAGATSASYTLAAAALSDSGATFAVTVVNAGGTVTSGAATLTVTPVPPSIANNVAQTVTVAQGATATLAVTASGSAPLAFQWRRGGVAIPGATSATYTTPATTAADNGAVFDVVVSNGAGTVTSAPFTLVVTSTAQAPTITAQPQSIVVRVGNPATFTVTAAGTGPFTYQWQRNGTAIAGATAATYTFTSTFADNGAQFNVVVSNAAGSVTSAVATLTVTAQPSVAVFVGDIGGPGTIDGTGPAARFLSPYGVAVDAAGNAYVTDGNEVRKVTAAGVVTTIAGSPTAGSADGSGSAATFRAPKGVAVDAGGNVYVVDGGNQTIRVISPAGVVSTLAGVAQTPGSADGTGAAARFSSPTAIAIDANGILYVADTGNQTIRRIAGNVVTTLAGVAGQAGSTDGATGQATFNAPAGVAVDGQGTVFVADTGNDTIRAIAGGLVATRAGTAGAVGTADGTGAAARFSAPTGLSIDGSGNVIVADSGGPTIRRVTPAGVVTTLAGVASTVGYADGSGGAATFAAPLGVAVDAGGSVWVTDRDNYSVRRLSPAIVVATIAGAPLVQGSADGTGTAATFTVPVGIAVDAAGNVDVGDYFDNAIRRITPAGAVTTLAGLPGTPGAADGTGSAARFATPQGVAFDAAGNLYVADKNNQTIRKVTPGGVVTTLAGNPGVVGSTDGTGSGATFSFPNAVAVDGAGNVFVTDSANTIRRITPAGVVTTLAGTANQVGSADGAGAAARFNLPYGITADASGNLYVTDGNNGTVRRVTSAGVVTTIAGTAGQTGNVDGQGAAARFTLPTGIARDAQGNLYVADVLARTIRKVDTAGNVTTVAGVADGLTGVRSGSLPGHFSTPIQIAIDAAGTLYVTDANAVLKIVLP